MNTNEHNDFSGRGVSRRTLLGIGAAVLVGACSGDGEGAADLSTPQSTDARTPSTTAVADSTNATPATSPATAATVEPSCELIPGETAGPYPGDGSNGPNALADPAVVRRNMADGFGDATGTAEGVATIIRFRVTDIANGCAAYPGAAVYAWHCDAEGRYSMYDLPDQNYLRAVQAADEAGMVEFDSVFPGCYPGRWPHVHFEVYATVEDALAGEGLLATSQIAIPQAICDEVYGTDGYPGSAEALARLSLSTDNVFADDAAVRQLGTISGTMDEGLSMELAVAVDSSQRTVPGAGGGR